MSTGLVVYRWICPICSDERASISTRKKAALGGLAEHAFRSHVRTQDGGGHGPGGEVPASFDSFDLLEYVEIDDVDDSPDEASPVP